MTVVQMILRVVLYLRKSRDDDSPDALEKHRSRLLRLCEEQGYKIVDIFEEIVTGKSLRKRPEMLKLIELLKRGVADAVVVIDLDRLGRGDLEEWGYVLKIFQSNSVKIITPDAIHDPSDPNQAFIMNIQSSVANLELSKITRRLRDGKIEGAIMGKWTNGKPPYPYKYVKSVQTIGEKEIITGSVALDELKSKIYRQIIDWYLKDHLSTQEITVLLNRTGEPSPGGTKWHNASVSRLLVDEFHLGYIVCGKVLGRWDREIQSGLTKKPKSEWIRSASMSHQPLKTPEEHDAIIALMTQKRRRPVASRNGAYPLSGLVYCAKCGHRMRFQRKTSAKGETSDHIVCHYYGPLGNECDQMGAKFTDDVYQMILDEIRTQYLDEERMGQIAEEVESLTRKTKELSLLREQVQRREEAKRRAEFLYLEGIENEEFYRSYKAKYDQELSSLNSQIRNLERDIEGRKILSNEEIQQQIDQFFTKWKSATTSLEKNRLFSSIINKIWYNRDRDTGEVRISIEYL